MNLIGGSLTLVCVLIVLMMPRRWAVLGVFASICYITQGQALDVGGFHFHAVRIVLLAGFIRIVARRELRQLKPVNVDWVVIGYAIVAVVGVGLRTGIWQEPVGDSYNVFLSYIVFRCLVTSWEEAQVFFLDVAFLIIPLALCMVLESRTGKNIFDVMGGHEGGNEREGRLRCIGAFRGPHTAGTFGATLLPLFVGLYFTHVHRRGIIVAAIIAASAITYTSNSSGPMMAYLGALTGLVFWPLRTKMRKVRWGIVAFLVIMDLSMKPPIWYIMSKISDITGGDGWYRSYLMEQCYKDFSSWWLMGTNDTSGWAVTHMAWGGADICNMYVSCAANAGLLCLILFVLILVRCFQNLGVALNVARESLPDSEVLLWSLGAALFAHALTLTSVTYWDQMQVAWWGFVAIIPSVTSSVMASAPVVEFTEEISESPVTVSMPS